MTAAYSSPTDLAAVAAACSCGSWVLASTQGVGKHSLGNCQPCHHSLAGHSSAVLAFVFVLRPCSRNEDVEVLGCRCDKLGRLPA